MTRQKGDEGRVIKLRRLGTDQVVHIPEDMELPPGDAHVWQEGDRLMISPFPPQRPLLSDTGESEPH